MKKTAVIALYLEEQRGPMGEHSVGFCCFLFIWAFRFLHSCEIGPRCLVRGSGSCLVAVSDLGDLVTQKLLRVYGNHRAG